MGHLRALTYLSRATARVVMSRLISGPRRPTWSQRYEIVAEIVRMQFAEASNASLEQLRANIDSFGALENRKKRAQFRADTIADLPVEWVSPKSPNTEFANALIVLIHGGGYMMGSPKSHRTLMAGLSMATGLEVVGIDYRLAPEHPCPAAIDDVEAVYAELVEARGADKLILVGDSAGGGLCVSAMLRFKESGLAQPAGAALLSPWVDLRPRPNTFGNADTDYLQPEHLEAAAVGYAGELSREDPRVSPVLGDLKGLPPLLIFAGGQELILGDSRRLQKRAKERGVNTTLVVEEDEIHVFPMFFDHTPRGAHALEQIGRFIEDRLRP